MELTADEKDALTELINIGYGRAAGALSELTGYRVSLEVPSVTLHEIEVLVPKLANLIKVDVACVNQSFTGPIRGNAMLMMDEASAVTLSRVLTDERTLTQGFDSNVREIIVEVGNILLNACLGVFGNLLNVHLSFSVPRLQKAGVTRIMEAVTAESTESVRYGLMVHTRFQVKGGNVVGYLVIILGISSMDRLLLELKGWETRQRQ